ncbi:MAG: hypothetical protein Q8J89_03700 [Caulobacter sp.]|nr:hypothetical protein [Caulobacter sp.]
MSAVRRERVLKAAILVASAAGHGLVLALIGLNVPRPHERPEVDEEQVMVVDLFRPPPPPRAPRTDVPASTAPRASPVRPRAVAVPAPSAAPPLPMAPVPAPAAPAPAPKAGAGSGGAVSGQGAGQPDGDLRGALRGSTVGCANRTAVGLNRREIDGCDEKLGAGARDAAFIPAPMDRRKRDGFDARAAGKARDRAWREAPVPVGIDPKAAPGVITGLDKP